MSTYDYGHVNGQGQYGEFVALDLTHGTPPLEALIAVSARLTEALRRECPGLVRQGQIIEAAFAESADDGLPPNRGRIRSALDDICIGASAGTASLAYTRQLVQALGL
ncbi:hypothetical protein [Streptomyces misionensis]|uniref:hypothetical protein n=1 Tax=Streptomyces misionensis TaxID=67331 RepID=UPI0036878739